MDWINLDDKEKLVEFAKYFKQNNFFDEDKTTHSSFFVDYNEDTNTFDKSIMKYEIEKFIEIKDFFMKEWQKTTNFDYDLLSTIISSIAIKNKPEEGNKYTKEKDAIEQKESYEKISNNDSPPVFIYEF